MKASAIIRIVTYSVLIALLVSILVAGIGFDLFSSRSPAVSSGPIATNNSGTYGAASTEDIRQLEIEWVSGSITIQPGAQGEDIRFWDDYSGEDNYQLSYSVSNGKLKIQYCEEDWDDFHSGIRFNRPPEKNLTLAVPENWFCDNLELEAASAKLEIHKLNFGNVEIDNASGAIGFENCSIDTLDVDTVSGDVIYTGSLNQLDCDSASASIVLNLTNIPGSIDLDTASGNVDILLPENAGFTVKLDALSGKFQSEFNYRESSGQYVSGDGSCKIRVNAMSGSVNIRKDPN